MKMKFYPQRMISFVNFDIFLVFIGLIFPCCLPENRVALFKKVATKKGFRLRNEYVLKTIPVTSEVECSMVCLHEECCVSITYYASQTYKKNCQLNNILSSTYSGPWLRDENAHYYELVNVYQTLNRSCFTKCQNEVDCNETTGECLCSEGYTGSLRETPVGNNENVPARSCFEIKTQNSQANSGVYWIQLNTSNVTASPFLVYCDMDTYGGGWTLVYSYTFTNYDNFFKEDNAVTPCPNWSAAYADVEISTVPPLNETALGAMDYQLWQNIGEKFLIKSNINDWIVCEPNVNGGSIVRAVYGDISCVNIKNVATTCEGVEPYRISWLSNCGPRIYASTTFYRFDGSKNYCYPTHDPCNSGDTKNHKRNVLNPGGKIFLR